MTDEQHLPDGWAWTTLGELILQFVGGGTPSKDIPEFYEGTIPWFSVKDMRTRRPADSMDHISDAALNASTTNLIPADTIIIATRIGLGKVIRVPFEAAINQDLKALITPTELDKGFLEYWVVCSAQLLESLGSGTTVKGIRLETLSQLGFALAPLAEQRRIVAAIEQQFTRLDAGVAALKRAQVALKRYRAAVLKAAVEGSLTADWRNAHPAAEPAETLLARILAERRARWDADLRAKGKDPSKATYAEPKAPDIASLPTLPDGWCWATVEQLAREPMCNGISIKGSDNPPGVPALKLSAITDNGFNYNDRRYIPLSDYEAGRLTVLSGDFFVSRGNGSLRLVGRGALAQEPTEVIVFPDTMIRVRLYDEDALRRFVKVAWQSAPMRRQIESQARTTAGIYKISQHDIARFILPLPPLAEQEQIVAEVERRLSVVGELEATITANLKRAERLRQSILREAFAGRLVPQDASDEPAGVLLARILAERAEQAAAHHGRNGHGRRNGSAAQETEAAESIPAGAQQQVLWREEE